MPNRDYHNERREYQLEELNRDQLRTNPFEQFSQWMDDALLQKINDPTAMSLSTVDSQGQPHSRVVLLKQSSADGLVFFSHYDGDKGQQIAQNNKAALLFFWPELDRQIRIHGTVSKTSRNSSEEYFNSRPRDSQIAAACTPQSQVIPGRKTLQQNFEITEDQYKHGKVPCPDNWGGYLLVPNYFEFWQGRENRLHDRFMFELNNNHWDIERLSP